MHAEHGKAQAALVQQQMELHQAQMQYAQYGTVSVRQSTLIRPSAQCSTMCRILLLCMRRLDMVPHLHLPIMRRLHRHLANNRHHLRMGVHPLLLALIVPWTHTLPTGRCWSALSSIPTIFITTFHILGHSLGTTSIRNSLKNGRRVSNNNTLSTMLNRGMGLEMRRVQQGDPLHHRMGYHHHPRRRPHSLSAGPSPGSGVHTGLDPGFRVGMSCYCCNDFPSSLLYFQCIFFVRTGGMGCTARRHR